MKKLRLAGGLSEFILSPLESNILDLLWPDKTLKVREIYNKLKKKRKVALSSVAVILDRLHKKNIVDRKRENVRGGFRYLYYPTIGKKQFEVSIVENSVNKLINEFGNTAINYFNQRFSNGVKINYDK